MKILKEKFTKHIWVFLALAVFFATQPANVSASVSKKVQVKYYTINGKTTQQLKAQMKSKGPNGYWAYVNWYVNWKTKNCRVALKIKYTYPKWANSGQAPKATQKKWRRMISALKKHENGHARHGVSAAKEISKSNCKNPKAIIKKWAAKDKSYDRKTGHGRTQGVKLP